VLVDSKVGVTEAKAAVARGDDLTRGVRGGYLGMAARAVWVGGSEHPEAIESGLEVAP
jgi:hypothetical protein